jgi:C4-dicarboxylate transporter DctQ subunit
VSVVAWALGRADALLGRAEAAFIGVALALASGLLFANVILRYVFLRPLAWAEELTMYLMVWLVFVGGSVVVRTRGHIAVDVLPLLLSREGDRRLRIAASVVAVAFFGVLFYYSGQHTLRVRAAGQVMPAMLAPMWLAYLAMPVGSLLMGLRTLQLLVRLVADRDDTAPGAAPRD